LQYYHNILFFFFTTTLDHNFLEISNSRSPIHFKQYTHHSLPTRHRNTANTLSMLPKMDYSNNVLPICLLTFSTTVYVLGVVLGVVFVLTQPQREEQLLDDIYHTVCSAIETENAAKNCNCGNGDKKQGSRGYPAPGCSPRGSCKKRAAAAAQPTTAAATTTTTTTTTMGAVGWR
jgi:hypothetical protein